MHVRIKGTYMRFLPRCTYVPGTSGEQVKPNTKVRVNKRTYMKNIPRCTYERRDVHEDHTEMHIRPGY